MRAYIATCDTATFLPTLCRELVARHVVAPTFERRDIIKAMKFADGCPLLDKLKSPTFLAVGTERHLLFVNVIRSHLRPRILTRLLRWHWV
jgi:hypothetical protein